ncbi:MAG: outer membrane protein assembly factor BamD [Candidatus Omnitrophica bacterium]|nr:outer membrane protein assembly factor BamD [Candidatus Omnitrophota bacterium]
MKSLKAIIIFFLLMSINQVGSAFWIWSPKAEKWRNPQHSPLASPQAQLDRAMQIYEAENYQEAYKEFRKVIAHFPDAKQAPEAQYYMGKCLQALGNSYQAFKEYQKVVDSYPYSERISEIVEIEYKIGDYFLNRERNKWLGVVMDELFEHPSIEIFRKVIDNAPYSESAQASQYKLGLLYKSLARYEQAIDSFKALIEKYPESEWVEPAKYQLALCSARASLDSDYDQALTKEAKERFEEFIARHPDAEISQEAQKEFEELKDKEAEKYFNIAEFYYKQKEFKSAQVYYDYVLRNYPRSSWAEESKTKLQVIADKS